MYKILIVEDEAIIGMALAAELEDAGYSVVDICPSGEEALVLLKKQAVDLVILDVKLGDGIDGIDTMKEIKKVCSPQPKVFFISGNSDVFTTQQINKMHIDGFFVKPVNMSALLQQLDRLSKPGE